MPLETLLETTTSLTPFDFTAAGGIPTADALPAHEPWATRRWASQLDSFGGDEFAASSSSPAAPSPVWESSFSTKPNWGNGTSAKERIVIPQRQATDAFEFPPTGRVVSARKDVDVSAVIKKASQAAGAEQPWRLDANQTLPSRSRRREKLDGAALGEAISAGVHRPGIPVTAAVQNNLAKEPAFRSSDAFAGNFSGDFTGLFRSPGSMVGSTPKIAEEMPPIGWNKPLKIELADDNSLPKRKALSSRVQIEPNKTGRPGDLSPYQQVVQQRSVFRPTVAPVAEGNNLHFNKPSIQPGEATWNWREKYPMP